MRASLILAFVAGLLPLAAQGGAAAAQETDYASMLLKNESLLSAPPKNCDDKNAALNTFEMEQCAAVAFQKADRALNLAYSAAVKDGTRDRNDRLKQAQRHWLAFRNAECDWESLQYAGGTLAPVTMGNCLVKVTQDRMRQLSEGVEP